ncbi:hemagglutinin repeat-containing protein [Winslowiella sp. 2C04]|uniref:hemagglutinin repeat-containing protein n=1 Tax=Winslowiella sp. 2C04 TaxID=3416179 RepID=UPI003CEFAEA4
MNKHCYRLIFSRTHGELRVVSELARSCSTEPGQSRGIAAPRLWVTLRRAGWLLALAMFAGPALADGIVANGAAAPGQRPQVINTQNGLPQVNITAPNQAGVSHNHYQQFDVGQKGAILNNSAVMTSTQLAGMIQGNPNLNPNNAPARVILNEVNSNNPSQLRGFLEVAGGRAQVIVANPAGIVCNGCGTINAGRMTLTTGKPQLNADGSLAGYQVERGVVRIEGGGLNGDTRHDTEYVDILARAVQINAGVWAKQGVSVVAGRNRISADAKTVNALASDSSKPELAIDMGQMGGMYSGLISMVGTEAGVGVRNQGGQLQADKALTVSSEGKLIWQSGAQEAVTQAGGDIRLAARDDIEHSGKLHSGGTLSVESRSGGIKQSGTLAAAGDVQLTAAGNIQSSGHLLAGSDINSQLVRESNLMLNSQGDIRASGSLLSKKDVTLSGQRVDISQAQLAASRATVSAKQGGVALRQAKIDSGKLAINTAGDVDAQQAQVKASQWDVAGRNLFNQKAAWSQVGAGESRFSFGGTLDNTDGGIETRQLSLNAGSLINQRGRLVALDGVDQHWQIGGLLNNSSGELGSNGKLTLDAASMDNQSGTVKSQLALNVNTRGDINNGSGNLLAGKQLALKAGGAVDNRSGTLNGSQLQLTTQRLNNNQGQLISQGDLNLTASQRLDNQQGLVGAVGRLTINTDGEWNNRGGTAQSETQLNVSAQSIDNAEGKLLSGQQLTLKTAGAVQNRAGEISGETLDLQMQRLSNAQGKVIGEKSLSLSARQALDNAEGLLAAGERLTLRTDGELNNRGGTAQGNEQLSVAAQSVRNDEGKLLSGQQLTLNAAGALSNRAGEISGGSLEIFAQQLDNAQGKVIAAQNLNLLAQQALDNTKGLLEAGNSLSLRTTGNWDNRNGTAQGGGLVTATTGTLNNASGKLQSGGGLTLNSTGNVNNQAGILTAQQALSLGLNGELDNQSGTLTGNGRTVLRAAALRNAQGNINSLDSLNMQLTGALDNASGRIFSKLSQTLQAQDIFNQQGWIGSQGGWSAVSKTFDNRNGSVQSQQDATITASILNNAKGVLQSAASLVLRIAQDIDNRAGKISAQQRLSVQGSTGDAATGKLNNAAGQLLSGDALTLRAQALDNRQSGLLYSQQQMRLTLNAALDNRQGKLQSGAGLQLDAQSLLNSGGTFDSQQQLGLRIIGLLDNNGGALRSNGDQQITAGQVDNVQGVVSSGGGLTLQTARLDNSNGTFISQGSGVYRVDTLNNQQGKLHSGDALTLNTAQLNNQAGQLVSTRAMKLNAQQLDNSGQGTISSQAELELQADHFNNRDGGLLLGTTRTTVSAREIDNTAGRLQSSGSLLFSGLSSLDNRQGRILANGALGLNASIPAATSALALLNQGGIIQSGDTLTLNARTFDNQNGTLQSQQALTLAVQQDYTQRSGDTLSSNSAVTLSVAGVLTNLGNWLLPGNLTVTSTDFTNQGSLVGKVVQLTTGQLLNYGRLEADRMTLAVDTLDNDATLMGDEITVRSRIIDNHGRDAVMAATGSLQLQANERLTNRDGALLFSGDRLHLSSNDLIENRASFIEADGDVTLEARRLDNLREGLEIERDAEQSDYKWQRYNYYWRSYDMAVNPDKSTMAPTTQQLTFQDDAAAQSNRYGTLLAIDASGKRAQVRVKNNLGVMTDMWVNYLALQPNADGSYAMTFYETRGFRQENVPTPYQNTVWREFDWGSLEQWDPEKHLDIANVPFVTDYNNFRERTVTGTVTRDKLVSEGIGARILAGGNMVLRITEQLLNDASVITANGNLSIEGGGNVENKGYSINERRQENIVDHYDRDTVHWYPVFNTDETTALSTIDGIITGNGNVSISGAKITNTTVNQAQISSVEAALKAAEAERAEWERNPLAFDVQGITQDGTQLAPGSQPSQAADGSATSPVRPLLPAEQALTEKQHLGSVATSIPNNGLFSQHPAVGSPFLVVTDERFTSRSKFISSDYLMQQVGYDPAQVHKRLGDGFYEQRLVREQVLSLTGRASVHGEDAMTQYQTLMDNGAKVAEDFHLVPGVALTPEQIAALQQDIVWLVSETVETADGPQTVWVPKVYLAQSTLRLTADGALIAGGNLQLSADSINNAGNLFADQALSIDTKQFQHQGGDIKADSINVQADSLTLSTNLQDALRQATMSANDISLSGSNLLLQGAKLEATQNLSLSARNNLEITSAKSSNSINLEVISGAMGNRTSGGREDAGWRMAQVQGDLQRAQGSELSAGGNLSLKAGKDITVQGSQAKAGGELGVQAGGDIKLLAETTTNKTHLEANSSTSSVSNSFEEQRLQLSTLSGDQGATLVAGNKLLAEGAQVDSTKGSIDISAKDVTIKEAHQQSLDLDSENKRKGKTKSHREMESSQDQAVGSTFSGANGVSVTAREGDITLTGSALHSEQGEIALQAKKDVTLNSATERESLFMEERTEKKGFLKKSSTHTVKDDRVTSQTGSLLSGNSVSISAGKDLTVSGSAIAADQDVTLQAGNNVDISAATETEYHYLLEEKKKKGLLGGGGLGFTIGSQSTRHQIDENGTTQSQSVSTVGSSQGNVSITAGNQMHIGGADLVAGKDLSLSGDSVQIDPGYDQRTRVETFESKQSGLTLALSGAVGSALNTAVNTAQQARKESDSRLSALQNTKAVLSGVQAAQAQEAVNLNDNKSEMSGISISVSAGSQKSSSTQRQEQAISSGSTLNAGNNLNITATGKKGGANSGDIAITGSQLKAGGDTTLDAQRDLMLSAAADTQKTEGSNKSSGGNVGMSIGLGKNSGFSVFANANSSRGSENGDGTSWNETTLDSGGNVTLHSGRDTTLTGAQVSGEQITADVGRDLTLQSLQDSDRYDSKQTSVSGGFSIPIGAGSGSANLSVSKDKLHSNYDSVTDQTGLYAGKGGYDITVKQHTQLEGAVIASTADKDKNTLDTGTLGWSDIHNQADFSAEHSGGSFSSGGPVGSDLLTNLAGSALSGANNSGHASGSTQSAVSEGNLVIRDQDNQQQDVAELNRDTDHANDGSINPIFDKEKEQNRLKEAQLIGEIGMQVGDIARTQGELAATKAAKEKMKGVTAAQLKAAEDDWRKANPDKIPTAEQISEQAYQTFYNQAFKDSGFGTGGRVQQAIQAVTAVVQGLAGGDIAKALAGGSAPYLAEQIHKMTTDASGKVNTEANLMAHAVVGAVIAQINGNGALAGASGAVAGEYIAQQLYPGVNREDLTEEQRQSVSALGTLAAGLAGGLAGDSAADAVAGAQAGKNAVENNALSDIAQAQSEGKTLEQKAGEYVEAENERYKKANCGGMSAEACSVKMYTERREALKDTASFGADFVPIVGDIKGFAEAQSALDYLIATVGLVPVLGDSAGKIIKAADVALKKGDIAEASKLINKASDEIAGHLPSPGNISLPSSGVGSNAAFSVTNAQVGKKLGKHVEDFGGNPSNAADRQRVLGIINDIGSNPEKIIHGKFAGQGIGAGASRGDVFFRIKGNDVVVTKPDGSFVTILKDGVTNNTSVINALKGSPQ